MKRIHSSCFTNNNNFIKIEFIINIFDFVDCFFTTIRSIRKFQIKELPDNDNVKIEEELLLKHVDNKSYKILLDINGNKMGSIELSKLIDKSFISYPKITFIIGGSDGIDDRVLEKSNFRLSFGKNTYPHGVFRCLLLEQIYRSFKILNNESYHK